MKKLINNMFILLLILMLNSYNLKANLFRKIYSIKCKKSITKYKIKANNNLYILYQNKNNYLYLLNEKNKKETLILSDSLIDDFNFAINKNTLVIIYTKKNNNFLNYLIVDINNNKIIKKDIIYYTKAIAIYNLNLLFNNKKIIATFIEQYKHHSNIKAIIFSLKKNKILFNTTLYEKGYNFSPIIKKYSNKYLIVWTNINGDKKNIFYTFITDNLRYKAHLLTKNDFDNIAPSVIIDKKLIYIAWQENRLGNWNISLAVLKNIKLKSVYRITSTLVNHWQPQISIYKNKIFLFWLDKSEGKPALYFISKDITHNIWSSPEKVSNIKIFNTYNIIKDKSRIILISKNNNTFYYSYLKHSIYKISLKKYIKNNREIVITWNNNYPDIKYFAINITKNKHQHFFTPILKRGNNQFYLYSSQYSQLPTLYFQLAYYDDLNIKSKEFNILLTKANHISSKEKNEIWNEISVEDIYDNFVYNKSYYSISYTPEINYNIFIYKIFFYVINQFSQDNNKFLKVFNSLNENIDFNRLIEGDKILLPEYWGNVEFIQKINTTIDDALYEAEKKFNLKNKSYIYYILSENFKSFKTKKNSKKDDFLIIINP